MKSAIKNGTKVTLNLLLNIIGDSSYKKNFPHKLLLTNKQVSKLCKAVANNSSANIKLSKNSSTLICLIFTHSQSTNKRLQWNTFFAHFGALKYDMRKLFRLK